MSDDFNIKILDLKENEIENNNQDFIIETPFKNNIQSRKNYNDGQAMKTQNLDYQQQYKHQNNVNTIQQNNHLQTNQLKPYQSNHKTQQQSNLKQPNTEQHQQSNQ